MLNYLEQTALFQDLNLNTITNIAGFCETLLLDEGEVVISENDRENYDLFILIDGKIEVLTRNKASSDGEVVLAEQKFDLFGEISWLLRKPRSATIRCTAETELIRIDGDRLMRYLESDPQAGFLIMRRIACLLSQQLLNTNSLLKQILWNINI